MLWSPNIAGGDVDGPQGYTQFYPGDDVVDIAGLSFYALGEDKT
jgi:beta-mannanase